MEVYQDWLRRTLILLNLAFPEIRESHLSEHKSRLRSLELDSTKRESRIRSLELDSTKRESRIHSLELDIAKREARIHELGPKLLEQETRISSLQTALAAEHRETSEIADLKEQLAALQLELSVERREKREILDLKNQVVHRLNGIQTNASWQLALPLRYLDARRPNLVRGTAAFPKVLWWILGWRLRQRLRVRRFLNELLSTGLFNPVWYVENNPDVVLKGHNPIFVALPEFRESAKIFKNMTL